MSKIWFNGQFIPYEQGQIHIATHALHYGTSAWEGIRIYNSNAFMLEEHCKRLLSSAQKIHLSCTHKLQEIIQACKNIIEINQLRKGYIRPIIWLGSEEMRISGANCIVNTAVLAWDAFTDYNPNIPGLNMEISPWRKPGPSCIPSDLKAGGVYMMLSLIKNQATDRGFDDAIMLDTNERIAEATTSNIFLIKNNILYTPKINGFFLNGITRQVIIKLAKKNHIEVQEMNLKLQDLHDANSAFLTGTSIEVMPIAKVYDDFNKKEKIFDTSSHILQKLRNAYHEITSMK